MLQLILQNIFSFIAIISFIVFIHEFGHFFVARLCGVKIEVFAIGFGRELFGFNDKKNTRWKFCMIPLGGYVKMYGDKNGASTPDYENIANFSEAEKKQSFIFKNVYQKIAIVAAGPLANFILAITLFTILFRINGLSTVLPIVDEVLEKSAAFEVGLQKNDKILTINDKKINDFSDMQQIVATSAGQELQFEILRKNLATQNDLGEENGEILKLKITPKSQESVNIFGEKQRTGLLGISSKEVSHRDLNIFQAFCQANLESYRISVAILGAVGDLLTGKRELKELGGPIKIAKYSGKTVELGASVVIWFMAMISLNLGVMNLLPLPVLDGGHLLFYFFEAIFKRPLPQKIQQLGFQFGFAIIISLMIFTTYNDIWQLAFTK